MTSPNQHSKSQRVFSGIACWLSTAAVCLAPWLFGSAEPWNYLFITVLICFATGFWLLSMLLSPSQSSLSPVMLWPLLVLGLFLALQTLPLGESATILANPRATQAVRDAMETLDSIHVATTETLPLPAIPATLSVSPSSSQRSLWLYLSYATVFLIFANSILHWHQVRRISVVILVCGFILALLSTLQALSDSTLMMWFHKPRHGGTYFGTFTNRNHAGAFFNMLFGLSVGMLLSATAVHGAESLSIRERLLAFSTRHTSGILLMLFTAITMASAVIMSTSRGAAISLMLAVSTYLVCTRFLSGTGRRKLASVVLITVLTVAVLWIGWGPLVARLKTLSGVFGSGIPDSRIVATGATLLIFGLFPLVGSGYGTFKHTFPLFQPASIDFGRWNHAHNDWAQLLAEGGLIGSALVLGMFFLWLRWLIQRWDHMIHRAQVYVMGLGIGVGAMAFHSFLDYSLHKPANAWMLAALCGLITAAANLSSRASTTTREPSATQHDKPAPLIPLRAPVLAFSLAILALVTSTIIRNFQGELEFARFLYLARSVDEAATADPLNESLILEALSSANIIRRIDMSNADAYRDMSAILFSWAIAPSVSRINRLSLSEASASSANFAVRKAPTDYLAWVWLARTQALAGKWEAAEACLTQARFLRPSGARVTMFGTNPQQQH